MADDIVTILRADYPPKGCKCTLCQAADEIERLRDDIDTLLFAVQAPWNKQRQAAFVQKIRDIEARARLVPLSEPTVNPPLDQGGTNA